MELKSILYCVISLYYGCRVLGSLYCVVKNEVSHHSLVLDDVIFLNTEHLLSKFNMSIIDKEMHRKDVKKILEERTQLYISTTKKMMKKAARNFTYLVFGALIIYIFF